MFVYGHTRSKAVVNELFDAGVSISYTKVQEYRKELGSEVCRQYALDGAVVPNNLKENTFLVTAIDNIDVSGRSLFGTGELHGTFITATQHQTDASIDWP